MIQLELYTNGHWLTAADIEFGNHGEVTLRYLPEYFTDKAIAYDSRAEQALSVNAPVSAIETRYKRWPGLFDDLLPVGKARDWWLQRLGIQNLSYAEQQPLLLAHAVIAPVGNIRVKQAFEQSPTTAAQHFFTIAEVGALEYDFLEFASNRGAAVGGATGAHGVAPKLLLQLDDQQRVSIDADFAGNAKIATPYLVKFARNNRSERDNQIVQAEYSFYRTLHQLLGTSGIETMNPAHMLLYTDPATRQSSLWLPRFDVYEQQGTLQRLGMESIYSILDVSAGAQCNHFAVIDSVLERLQGLLAISTADFVKQYVVRDFLNMVFGNSDNHGRNISFLKRNGQLYLAPIYDFAPMKADLEFISRSFTWGQPYENAGSVNYPLIATKLARHIAPEELLSTLTELAEQLRDLPDLLEANGCPVEIIAIPALALWSVEQRMRDYGVLS